MKKDFNKIGINFRVQKNANQDKFVLLLHGWGGSLNSFRGLEDFLIKNDYSVINIDFPGFGNSDMPREDFCLDDYVRIVAEIIEFLGQKKVDVVAHSFGGRVAIKLASLTEYVDKLILVDSAGIKPKFSLINYLKIKRYKFLKFLKKIKIVEKDLSKFGSQDYIALPNQMKGVFVRVINEDLTKLLAKISCPTLLIWGEKDESTPLYMAKKMEKNIKNCGIVVFKNAGHFSYLENHSQFCLIVDSFLK